MRSLVNTLRSLFLTSVRRSPSALFLEDVNQSLSYQEVLEGARRRARFLVDRGVELGDRVFLVDEDPIETTLWLFACILIGSVFVVLHRDTSAQRMRILLEDASPVGVMDLGQGRSEAYYEYGLKLNFVIDSRDIAVHLKPLECELDIDIIETDLAFLVYTSGSTGRPKGIMCPHRSVLAAISAINEFLKNSSSDRIGILLPLSFDYGLYQIFLAMQVGASVTFLGNFNSPLQLLGLLRKHRITGFPALRSVLVPLARMSAAECKLEELRYVTNTGDALPPSLIEKILKNFTGVHLFSMYGLSECKRALYMPPDRLASKPSSVGRPIPGTRAYIMSEKGGLLPRGKIGELVLEGPHIMVGYWNAPQETAEKFIFGHSGQPRLRSGDLFFQDIDGDFHFVARKSEIIKSRGFRISPREVEAALLAADPVVRECLVYGVEDELLGQAVCADVTVEDPKHTIPEIFARCREVMDGHLIPTRIRIVESLPKTSSGKYNRRSVMESLT